MCFLALQSYWFTFPLPSAIAHTSPTLLLKHWYYLTFRREKKNYKKPTFHRIDSKKVLSSLLLQWTIASAFKFLDLSASHSFLLILRDFLSVLSCHSLGGINFTHAISLIPSYVKILYGLLSCNKRKFPSAQYLL